MFQTTRRRLALWYTTVTAILLLFFATGVYLYVRNTLIDRIDDTLKHVVEVVERSLIVQTAPSEIDPYRVNVEASFGSHPKAVEDDRIDLEWFNADGQLVWSTLNEPFEMPLHRHHARETAVLSTQRSWRQLTEPIRVERHLVGYLRVSHPWFEVTKPIRQLTIDLVIGTTAMVLCVAGIGWFLSGIAMRPVHDSYQSLKQFTADASHELRNPIATIQTNVQMVLAYPEADPQLQQRQLKIIERLTQRLGHLVNDLLFLARSDSGMLQTEFHDVPLDALLIEVIEEQRAIADQKAAFLSLHLLESMDRDGTNVTPTMNEQAAEAYFSLKGDWDQLARLFTNLISNGLEYLQADEPQAAIEVTLQRLQKERQAYLQVQVRDTGPGIAAANQPFIFERFYRVDCARSRNPQVSASSGSGLGLAIAQAIAHNHHGQITLNSQVGQGCTFTVMLPTQKLTPFSFPAPSTETAEA